MVGIRAKKNHNWLAIYLFQRINKLAGRAIVFAGYETQNVITNINRKLPSKLKKLNRSHFFQPKKLCAREHIA